jgi:putative transposase
MKTYKYRIYPTKAQETSLDKMLEECRWLYNKILETRNNTYEQTGISLGLYDTQNMIPDWKKERPSLKIVHSLVLQNVNIRVQLAYQAFFRRVKSGEEKAGFPRFKGEGRYDSMTFPQYGNGVRIDGNTLVLSKLGSIKIKFHRGLCGTPKTVCVRRSRTGKWFATFPCECAETPLPTELKTIGIDVGTSTFATMSDGEKVKNPRFFKQEQKALAKANRKLDKIEKGTFARKKQKKVISRIHERIANQRTDFAHKQSRTWVDTYGVIVMEELNIVGMMAEHKIVFGNKLNKSIADVAWNQLAQFTAYKAEDAGRLFMQVDPRNTSKICSRCSALVPKDLSLRVHNCPHCGLVLDRDHNAAINILALGLQRINAGLPEEVVEAQRL